jgi:hypothetical protein
MVLRRIIRHRTTFNDARQPGSWLSYRLCNQSRAARIEDRNEVIASEFSGRGSEGFSHVAVVS